MAGLPSVLTRSPTSNSGLTCLGDSNGELVPDIRKGDIGGVDTRGECANIANLIGWGGDFGVVFGVDLLFIKLSLTLLGIIRGSSFVEVSRCGVDCLVDFRKFITSGVFLNSGVRLTSGDRLVVTSGVFGAVTSGSRVGLVILVGVTPLARLVGGAFRERRSFVETLGTADSTFDWIVSDSWALVVN